MAENIFALINEYRQKAPVNVENLIKELGINLNRSFLAADISGMVECNDKKEYSITVNAADSPFRQRFTMAHELGHYILHRDILGDGITDNRMYRSDAGSIYNNQLVNSSHETEANKFAASLLMPKPLIEELKKSGITDVAALAKKTKGFRTCNVYCHWCAI